MNRTRRLKLDKHEYKLLSLIPKASQLSLFVANPKHAALPRYGIRAEFNNATYSIAFDTDALRTHAMGILRRRV